LWNWLAVNPPSETGVYRTSYEYITVEHAKELLQARVSQAALRDLDSNPLGCYFTELVQPWPKNCTKAYIKIDLRNVKSRVPGFETRKISGNLWLHAIAILTQPDERWKLALTHGGERFHCSHLCHNHWCFNPAHIVVEIAADNLLRNSCHDQKIVEFKDPHSGQISKYHPCVHGDHGVMRRCILPTILMHDQIPGHFLQNSMVVPGTQRQKWQALRARFVNTQDPAFDGPENQAAVEPPEDIVYDAGFISEEDLYGVSD
jgi:hypothetical protein